jgi:hypothetical protein
VIAFKNSPRTKKNDGRSGRRRGRLAALGLSAAGLTVITLGVAAPAQAGPNVAFEIFYGQNCAQGGTASQIYVGVRNEPWITDTFNSSQWGSAGYGQRIRENAASVYVHSGGLSISTSGGYSWHFASGPGECFNLNSETRNQNVGFSTD